MKTAESQEPDINADIKQLTPELLNSFMALLRDQHGLTRVTPANFTKALRAYAESSEFDDRHMPIIDVLNAITIGVNRALKNLKATKGASVDAGN